ncbi:MAG: phage Gp37/Gp68 family protein [Azoarcus sp.]|jgi:protein gp37|nr:phage Gp37/Gp68 family protein [Azoarcus sp.]
MGTLGYENEFRLTLHENRLKQPMARKKPTVYFVNSMSDLFHSDVSDEFLDRVFSIIDATPRHQYQILTKHAARLPVYFARRACPDNVWLGVSVEDRTYGIPRIEHLRQVDARIRFLSVEPLLVTPEQLSTH